MQQIRLLSNATLSAGAAPDLPMDGRDFAAADRLDIVIRVLTAGTGDGAVTLKIMHAPENDADVYLDFATAVEVSLTETGLYWFHVDSFTRWVAWFVSGTLTSDAVVTVDVIGRS